MKQLIFALLLCADALTLHAAETADTKAPLQRIFFTPDPAKSGYLWDVWRTVHEGKYHLCYLAGKDGKPGRAFDNISLAVSDDGVSWNEHGQLRVHSSEGTTQKREIEFKPAAK